MSFATLLALLSLVIWLVLLFGRGDFWRVAFPPRFPDPPRWPVVAAVVPARNEAKGVGQAIASLLAQDYPGPFRIILVDDHSTDGTAQAAGSDPLLTVIPARDLPPGWSGKVWAQSEGLALAEGADYVLLTDADIHHPPDAVSALVARAEAERRDLVSLMVRLRCESLPEKALIPAFVFFFAKLYPFRWVNDPASTTAAAAGGCMLVRQSALARIGGLAAIKGALIDDCSLAAAIKRNGSISLDLADRTLSLRAYDSGGEIWRMITRTAYTQLQRSPLLLAGAVLGMTVTYLVPPVLTLSGSLPALLAWIAMGAAYAPTLRYYRLPLIWAPLLPLTALFYIGATLDSARRHWQGIGGQWKGRVQADGA